MRRTTRVRIGVLTGLIAGICLLTLGSPTRADDRPLWKIKGTPTGKIHGGDEGSPFRDKARGRLAQVIVRAGSWLDSVRCVWEDEGAMEKGDTQGGDGGDETVFKLEPGEALIQVSGVLLKQGDSTVIGSLTFKTTKRTVGPIGKVLDGPKFSLDAPKGQEICGFQGRGGDYLAAIGMVCRDKP